MKTRSLFVLVGLMFVLAHTPVAASKALTVGGCDSANYVALEAIRFDGGSIVLASECGNGGQLALLSVPDSGAAHVARSLPALDPGSSQLVRNSTELGDYVAFIREHEPTGDDETYYVALLSIEEGSVSFVGELWSYGLPGFASTTSFDYVTTSVNPYGWTEPDAPGWPVAHKISGDRLVGTPLSSVPAYSCSAGVAIERYLSAVAPAASNKRSSSNTRENAVAQNLKVHCQSTDGL